MNNASDQKISLLLNRLQELSRKQEEFSFEIQQLRKEIETLQEEKKASEHPEQAESSPEESSYGQPVPQEDPLSPDATSLSPSENDSLVVTPAVQSEKPTAKPSGKKNNLEKFIGENLISKVGIIITVIGVAIGITYTIEHDLLTPVARVAMGYVAGALLLSTGLWMKKKYENFSAVLLSGAMAIMYFSTWAAHSLYELIPLGLAFSLMVLFTVFTVVAAIVYNRSVIAHIGLVGAYAVPFLLVDSTQKVTVLLFYMAIVNTGILVLSVYKYWKSLYYVAFGFTWLIFLSWLLFEYVVADHFALALGFLSGFFILFYLCFLAYKLMHQEKFGIHDVFLLLANSFIFYGMGYVLLEDYGVGKAMLGWFTLGNALVHFVLSAWVYRQRLVDKNVLYLLSGLGLVFVTIAIPVRLEGSWITLLWTAEAALLFWIGRTQKAVFYEKLSYPLMIVAFVSIWMDWEMAYVATRKITPIFNYHFLGSVFFMGAFSFMSLLGKKMRVPHQAGFLKLLSHTAPFMLILSAYLAFAYEIAHFWNWQQHQLSVDHVYQGVAGHFSLTDLESLKVIWLINFSMFFLSALLLVNLRWFKNPVAGNITLGMNVFAMAVFLTSGLHLISGLRESFLEHQSVQMYLQNSAQLFHRYFSLAIWAGLLWACFRYTRNHFAKTNFKVPWELCMHLAILWVASNELVQWLVVAEVSQTHKLGLSILWGSYALLLIVWGISQRKKHLRIAAIILFGVTLLKLFLYDITHLDTLAKTILFMALGILLLIISFLYNKYKHMLFDQ